MYDSDLINLKISETEYQVYIDKESLPPGKRFLDGQTNTNAMGEHEL